MDGFVTRVNNKYSCRFKGCNRLFSNKECLKSHLKSHSKLFKVRHNVKCPMVDCKWSGSDGSVRKHIRKKHS